MEEEVFKEIPGFEGCYRISNFGRAQTCKLRGYPIGGKCRTSDVWKDLAFIFINGYRIYTFSIKCPVRKRTINKKMRAHILVWQTFVGAIPEGYELDHIDRNRLDPKLTNLRLATVTQNLWNSAKRKTQGKGLPTSQYKGVYWGKRHCKWIAEIRVHKKKLYLGAFNDEKDAALAYNIKALRHFGDFANINKFSE